MRIGLPDPAAFAEMMHNDPAYWEGKARWHRELAAQMDPLHRKRQLAKAASCDAEAARLKGEA